MEAKQVKWFLRRCTKPSYRAVKHDARLVGTCVAIIGSVAFFIKLFMYFFNYLLL